MKCIEDEAIRVHSLLVVPLICSQPLRCIENRDLSLQEFKSRYGAAVTRRWALGKEL